MEYFLRVVDDLLMTSVRLILTPAPFSFLQGSMGNFPSTWHMHTNFPHSHFDYSQTL